MDTPPPANTQPKRNGGDPISFPPVLSLLFFTLSTIYHLVKSPPHIGLAVVSALVVASLLLIYGSYRLPRLSDRQRTVLKNTAGITGLICAFLWMAMIFTLI
jgi:hypothetical protein